MKYFYSQLIEVHSVTQKLDELNMQDDHKAHLANLVDSHIHHTVMDVILSELSEEDKLLFLEKISENPEDPELLQFLNTRSEKIEEKIKKAVEDLKKELHEDIEKSKEK
jgi:hypothetical protein